MKDKTNHCIGKYPGTVFDIIIIFLFFIKYDTCNTYLGLKGTVVMESSAMLSHNSWFLHNLWRVCWTPQSAHNGSGTSHVLQKSVAFDFMSPWRQGSQNISSFLSWSSLKLKQLVFFIIKVIKHKFFNYTWQSFNWFIINLINIVFFLNRVLQFWRIILGLRLH